MFSFFGIQATEKKKLRKLFGPRQSSRAVAVAKAEVVAKERDQVKAKRAKARRRRSRLLM